MSLLPNSNRSLFSAILGIVTFVSVALLLGWDAFPGFYPSGSHATLGAFSLALIALAYLVFQIARRPAPAELFKAILLAIAFLFWAANQLWADSPRATLFNDVAIALFVLDVFLAISGWPRASRDSSFAGSEPVSCGEFCRYIEAPHDAACCAASNRRGCCSAGPISAG